MNEDTPEAFNVAPSAFPINCTWVLLHVELCEVTVVYHQFNAPKLVLIIHNIVHQSSSIYTT